MKAYAIKKYGKIPLELMTFPVPEVGESDILAEIHAASVNPVDFKMRNGKVKILLKYKMPLILGNDFAGVVTKIGKKVTKFKVGDEIYARVPKNRIGTFAEYIAVHEKAVAIKPKNLSFEEAASIPLVGLTSYQALCDIMHLEKDQKILIQAGAGGVGTFAIQLAKIIGAHVTTTVSDAGMELVKSLGADSVINYRQQNFEDVLTNCDAVYDTLGGEYLEKAFSIVKPNGNIVSISGLPNAKFGKQYKVGTLKTLLFSLVTRKITKLEKRSGVKYTFLFMSDSGEQLDIIRNFIEDGKIRPIVDRIFPFSETQKALDYVESGRAKGKVIVKIK
ncbi:NADP-dependent oxidoreductase [Candidatus Uabimicrobium sp. HlEnr_7]|uniref:NADP-dependent oxidoreductase n=1 Tax=Candidatus Uabimicrobium helgolandensis TaxID=3095367 RepID=UPI0035565FBF